ncbi:MAG: phosphoenolpyruvate mutase [Euryarchaeota archaeon]|nr:phosphoenolpyruvate mutase [Euryarchaeota archaeon]
MKNKIVYVTLSIDLLHHGHINLIKQAKKYGIVIAGLLTDNAIASQKRLPLLSYNQRKKILENISGVSKVVEQKEWDCSNNILKLKPDYMVHGDDWKLGYQKIFRSRALNSLKKIGGKLIEIPYTKNISSFALKERIHQEATTPSNRQLILKRLIEAKNLSRFIEAHSPLSAIIAEKTFHVNKNGKKLEFDGFWSSSLTDSTLKGKPDIEILDINQRLSNINDIFDVTTKPLIIDIDTGGKIEHLEINLKTIERSGASAVIMEDKKGLKKNSLFGNEVKQQQAEIKEFTKKILASKKATTNKLMIIARIESLILGKSLNDAILRAEKYVEAGADGIMIHSKDKSPQKILKFAQKFKKNFMNVPLVAVPSSYNSVKENQLEEAGFNIVIYANQMLRASYPAMRKIALDILKNGRSYESEKSIMSIKDILKLIPGTK